jgi:hypothetical protein
MGEPNIFVMGRPKEASAGVFTLPAEFDTAKHAAEWVKKGPDVDAKRAAQPILGTNFGAVGWTPWAYPAGHALAKRPAEVTVKGGTYILMCRPRSVQNDVNAIYGNVSKQHLVREQSGQTIAGSPVEGGMLSDSRIREATGITEFGGEDLRVEMNPVAVAPRVEAQPVATAET